MPTLEFYLNYQKTLENMIEQGEKEVKVKLQKLETRLAQMNNNFILGQPRIYGNDTYYGNIIGEDRNGVGLYTYKAGCTYFGEWSNNKRHGEGTATYPNNFELKTYKGEQIGGNRNGFGTSEYHIGDCYIGNFIEDERHGFGIYKGSFTKKGLFGDGGGKITGVDIFSETIFWGTFNSIKDCTGIGLLYNNGILEYAGNYLNGKKHGHGFQKKEDDFEEGLFADGKLIISQGIVISNFKKSLLDNSKFDVIIVTEF